MLSELPRRLALRVLRGRPEMPAITKDWRPFRLRGRRRNDPRRRSGMSCRTSSWPICPHRTMKYGRSP
eukprot:5257573-Lingulodinium_polyedra.AAC.1